MKRCLFIFAVILLTACSQEENEQNNGVTEERTLVVYESDANAEYVIPREVGYPKEMEQSAIRFIFDEVVIEPVKLLDYKLANGDTTLILNLDDGVLLVQGSAGGQMFMGALAETYFENLPYVQEIVLLHNGSSEELLDHVFIGQPITRAQSFKKQ
ncbi:hypothetical protein P9B03_05495 [Metasolibacillus meyeri]|uniref:GerMN domain-containing protein n=1 Tax=Metasolibacillus meyeri TaxID=1071052 RepID=A0AAW9NST5_9BACL|nr:hypothetical protein [Metasolibacillus meyeri]MEC1177931.1 hypothetical protein [Metasolibacillus meyeri]